MQPQTLQEKGLPTGSRDFWMAQAGEPATVRAVALPKIIILYMCPQSASRMAATDTLDLNEQLCQQS